jgi:uncharacterized membrane protein
MTLLVLDLKLPEPVPAGDVQAQIIAVLPKLLVYVTVFAFATSRRLQYSTARDGAGRAARPR